MDNLQKLAIVGVVVLVIWLLFKNGTIQVPQTNSQPTRAPNNSNSQNSSSDKINSSTTANTSVDPRKPQIIEYGGTATDEEGNVIRVTLRFKSDLTQASLEQNGAMGPFLPIRELSAGRYQFIVEGGAMPGDSFTYSSYGVCKVYDPIGHYFCTLYRRSTSTDIPQNTASSPTQQTIASPPIIAGDTTVKKEPTSKNCDIWTGKQPAYNAKNESGQDIIVNGSPVITQACEWTFTIMNDGSISAKQIDLQDNTIAYYKGGGGGDANVSNGVTLLHCTFSSSDNSSTFSLTLRLYNNKTGLCFPDTHNGPSFPISEK